MYLVDTDKLLVSNIQRYSLHDGPGIRTTVFLKGCSLHCPWCSNPENIESDNQLWFDREKCIGDTTYCILNKRCNIKYAEKNAGKKLHDHIFDDECAIRALQPIAKEYSAAELLDEIWKDIPFWDTNGGVTFSGGEALLQIKNLFPVLKELKAKRIHICFESALFVETELLKEGLQYIDELYVDMKCLDAKECRKYLGGDLNIYLNNITFLEESFFPYIIRIPLIKPYTYSENNLKKINSYISCLHPKSIELFACHNLGEKKYRMCGKTSADYNNVTIDELHCMADEIRETGKSVSILQI